MKRYLIRMSLAAIMLTFSSLTLANTYYNCTVDEVMTHEVYQNLVIVTTSCVAPDAMTTGVNCTGTINPRAFVFDMSNATGKGHMALVLTAMAGGNSIRAATYGACPSNISDTLWLYSLKVLS